MLSTKSNYEADEIDAQKYGWEGVDWTTEITDQSWKKMIFVYLIYFT